MLNPSSNKIKAKKLRRRVNKNRPTVTIVSAKNKTEVLYNKILEKVASPLPEELKDEKFFNLLQNYHRGFVSTSILIAIGKIPSDMLLAGTITKVLHPNEPIRTLFELEHVSIGVESWSKFLNAIVMRRNNGNIVLFAKNGGNWEFKPNQWIYAKLVRETIMPVDLRSWTTGWVASYFTAKTSPKTSYAAFLGKSLLQIRRTNLSPSKKQHQKINKSVTKQVFDADAIELENELTPNNY